MNPQQLMKQAQQMQERMQKQMAELKVEGNAGGGMVTVTMNGAKQVLALKLDPEAVSKDDVEMLQDLILAAINDAQRKVDEGLQQQMSGLMGGMKIPGIRPPIFEARSSSTLRCASLTAARIMSCSISTSSFDTTSGSILID